MRCLTYEPLWRTLRKNGISKMEFAKFVNISNATLAKLGKNEPVTLTIIIKICNKLDCNIEDIISYDFIDSFKRELTDVNINSLNEAIRKDIISIDWDRYDKEIKNIQKEN